MRLRDLCTIWFFCAVGLALLARSGDPSEWSIGDPISLGVIDRAVWGATTATGIVGVIGLGEVVSRLWRRLKRERPVGFPVELATGVEPVTADDPLVGIETLELKTWLENSPSLRSA